MAKNRKQTVVDGPEIRFKIRVGNGAIGPGKIFLLRAIDSCGSISSAAKECGMNYRRAQYLLETLTEAVGSPIVTTIIGGAQGGGAQLTPTGQALIHTYDQLKQSINRTADKELKNLGNLLVGAKQD